MKLTTRSSAPVYTIAGASSARPLPEWLARKRKRSLKQDPEYSNRIELLQDFEFEEASSCVRISEDGDWVVSTGKHYERLHLACVLMADSDMMSRDIQASDTYTLSSTSLSLVCAAYRCTQPYLSTLILRLLKVPPSSVRPLP